jgi:tetratricopeptide (TPR) repeat protein
VGYALDTVGKTEEAIAQFHKTIEMDPNFPNSRDLFGNVLENDGRLKEAIVEYESRTHSTQILLPPRSSRGLTFSSAGKRRRSNFGRT